MWNDLISEIIIHKSLERSIIDLFPSHQGKYYHEKKDLLMMIFCSPSCPENIKQIARDALSISNREFSRIFIGYPSWLNKFIRHEGLFLYYIVNLQHRIKILDQNDFSRKSGLKRDYGVSNKDLLAFKEHVIKAVYEWHIKHGKIDLEMTESSAANGRTIDLELKNYKAIQAFMISVIIYQRKRLRRYEYIEDLEMLPIPIKFSTSPLWYFGQPKTMSLEIAQVLIDNVEVFIEELSNLHPSKERQELMKHHQQTKRLLNDFKETKEKLRVKVRDKLRKRLRKNSDYQVYLDKIPNYAHQLYVLLSRTQRNKGGITPALYKEIDDAVDNDNFFSMSTLEDYTTLINIREYNNILFPLLKNDKSGILETDHSDTLKEVIKEAQNWADSEFLAEKVKEGFKIAKVPPKFQISDKDGEGWQPWHVRHIPVLFNKLKDKGLIAIETLVYYKNEGKIFAGHIDFLVHIDDTIYIFDYKPKADFSLNPKYVSNIFIDKVPQVGGYGVLMAKSHLYRDLRYNPNLKIQCVIYNRDGYVVFNPENALAAYIAFLRHPDVKGSRADIPFDSLVPRELIEKYMGMIGY